MRGLGSISKLIFLILFSFLTGTASAEEPAAAKPPATTPSPPEFKIIKVAVGKRKALCQWLPCRAFSSIYASDEQAGVTLDSKNVGRSTSEFSNHLVGSGDVHIWIDAASYASAIQYIKDYPTPLYLFINGVEIADDARLVAVKEEISGWHLQYRIRPGNHSQMLWANLYRAHGLTGAEPMNVALGWKGSGVRSKMVGGAASSNIVSITTPEARTTALLAVLLLAIGSLTVTVFTDILRDKPAPSWLQEAQRLRNHLLQHPGSRRKFLENTFGSNYDSTRENEYIDFAEGVATRSLVVTPENERKAVIGLVLMQNPIQAPKPSFSLARVQLGIWFLFAISAAIFLSLAQGQLVPLDGSVLALLGLSAGTFAMGNAADSEEKHFYGTRGFFTDLLTDSENRYQVSRFQAVVVNLLLLGVGCIHVLNQLTYPVFDGTWLTLLGISAATYGAGKQFAEAKSTQAPTGATIAPPAAENPSTTSTATSPGGTKAAAPMAAPPKGAHI